MEATSLFVGIILMMVAVIGIFLYAALVIAIPVCRMLDWFFNQEPRDRAVQSSRHGRAMRATIRWLGGSRHDASTSHHHDGGNQGGNA
jgi:hypothetical protein